jgi:hypothetical protein
VVELKALDLVCQKARIIVHEPTGTTIAPSESSAGRSNRERAVLGEIDAHQIQKVLSRNPDLSSVVGPAFLCLRMQLKGVDVVDVIRLTEGFSLHIFSSLLLSSLPSLLFLPFFSLITAIDL